MPYCGSASIVKHKASSAEARTLPCRSWHCENCFPQRKKQLIRECLGGNPDTFLTLTIRRVPGKNPNQAALELTRAWRLVRLRWKRYYELDTLPFMAIMEATKAGWPHLHILLRQHWCDWFRIRDWMLEICDSPHVWIVRITQRSRVMGYCAKYAGKAAHKFGTAKRYFQSRDYDQSDYDATHRNTDGLSTWDYTDTPLTRLSLDYQRRGYRIAWGGWDRFVAVAIPHKGGAPP